MDAQLATKPRGRDAEHGGVGGEAYGCECAEHQHQEGQAEDVIGNVVLHRAAAWVRVRVGVGDMIRVRVRVTEGG